MIKPRSVELADRPGVLELVREAFESQLESLLVERLWSSNSFVAEHIVEDGGVIAFAGVSEVSIGFLGPEHKFGEGLGLAPVATAAARRNEGLGANVVSAAMEAAFSRYPNRLMFVLGEPEYYQRFGFAPALPLGFIWEGGDVGDAFQVTSADGRLSPFRNDRAESGMRDLATVYYNDAFSVFSEQN